MLPSVRVRGATAGALPGMVIVTDTELCLVASDAPAPVSAALEMLDGVAIAPGICVAKLFNQTPTSLIHALPRTELCADTSAVIEPSLLEMVIESIAMDVPVELEWS